MYQFGSKKAISRNKRNRSLDTEERKREGGGSGKCEDLKAV